MANRQSRFQVIDGGTGGGGNEVYINTGFVDGTGRPMFRKVKTDSDGGSPPPPPGGHDVSIGKLEQSVGWLWKSVGAIFTLGLTAIIVSYLMLASRIDDRYDKIGGKIDGVVDKIADLRVEVVESRKADDQSQAGSRAGQTGAVPRETGSGAKPKG
jgi:hypothetical protein